MSKKLMQTTPCVASLKNEMAIAYLNSGIQFHRYHKHKHDSSEEDHEFGGLKPCLSHFDTRMAIGTHVARWENLDRWSTKAARPFYVSLLPNTVARFVCLVMMYFFKNAKLLMHLTR